MTGGLTLQWAGPVFAVVQGIVLVFFVVVIIGAWRRFKPMAAFA